MPAAMTCDVSSGARWVGVAELDDLADRAIVAVRVNGHSLLLVRDGPAIHVCQRLCPHDFVDLKAGRVVGGALFCPRHDACFSLRDGASGNGWQLDPLKLYPTQVIGGRVAVDAAAVEARPPFRTRRL